MSVFEVSSGDFSGPLDLLVHLVERSEINIYKVSLAELADDYLRYIYTLSMEQRNLEDMSDFLVLASRLFRMKAMALLPRQEDPEMTEEYCDDVAENPLRDQVERYLPYRRATAWLGVRFNDNSMRYRRRESEREDAPLFEIGDIYSLSITWWKLWEKRTKNALDDERGDISKVSPPAEKEQISKRMTVLLARLPDTDEIAMKELLEDIESRALFLVSLLALLELTRLRLVSIRQPNQLGEIFIRRRPRT